MVGLEASRNLRGGKIQLTNGTCYLLKLYQKRDMAKFWRALVKSNRPLTQ